MVSAGSIPACELGQSAALNRLTSVSNDVTVALSAHRIGAIKNEA